MKNLLFVIIILLISPFNGKAQEKVTGTLEGWENGQADIIMGMAKPVRVGTIQESGAFTISLGDDLLAKTQKAMEQQNGGSSGGRFSLNTIGQAFSCYEKEAVTVSGGDQPALTLAMMGGIRVADLDQKKMYGSFMAASSREFAKAFRSFGQQDVVKGFYLNWYYVDEPASVTGTCATKTYAQNQEDSYEQTKQYNMDLKKGWNLVKISLDDTFTDADGKVYAAAWSYQTVDEMPEETTFMYFEE